VFVVVPVGFIALPAEPRGGHSQLQSACALLRFSPFLHTYNCIGVCSAPAPCIPQADRLANLLKGSPVKTGFKVAHTPPPPVSMYIDMPWQPSPAAAAGSMVSSIAPADKAKWMSADDFDALCNKQR
jgi:hypothetical protein